MPIITNNIESENIGNEATFTYGRFPLATYFEPFLCLEHSRASLKLMQVIRRDLVIDRIFDLHEYSSNTAEIHALMFSQPMISLIVWFFSCNNMTSSRPAIYLRSCYRSAYIFISQANFDECLRIRIISKKWRSCESEINRSSNSSRNIMQLPSIRIKLKESKFIEIHSWLELD